MRFLVLAFLIITGTYGQAQEMEFEVKINSPKLQTVDPKVFESLEGSIREFLNSQKWTTEVYEPAERIKCNLQMTITEEISPTSFKSEIALQATRPVFGSNYETPILKHVDKDVKFEYEQYQPLLYSDNAFNDNLTAVLSFYVYVILGIDYDSYAPLGGKEYINKANEIINQIPSTAKNSYSGWKVNDGKRNRYWIAENLLNNRIIPYRQAMYNYHRHGLDVMYEDVEKGKAVIAKALKTITEVHRNYTNTMIVQMFSNSKSSEIIEIFKQGQREQKNSVYQMMRKIDPTKNAEFRSIVR